MDDILGNIRYIGHATFKISGSKVVYTDPYQIKKPDKADIILVSHSHFDHCSIDDIKKLTGENTTVVCNKDCVDKIDDLVPHVIGLEPYQEANVTGVNIRAVPAYNLNKDFHPKSNRWNGYIFTLDGVSYYHPGDTDFIPEMKEISVDVIFLPVGGTYTMNWEEAARAAKVIKHRYAIPMHYGSVVGSIADAEKFKEAVGESAVILSQD